MKQHHIVKWAASLGLAFTGLLILGRPAKPVAAKPAPGSPSVAAHYHAAHLGRHRPNPEARRYDADLLRSRLSAAITLIQSAPDQLQREDLLQTVSSAVTRTDVPSAVQKLQEQEFSDTGHDLQSRLLRRWATDDPAAAAKWTTQMPSGDVRKEFLAGVAIEWAHRDLTAAVQWARDLENEDDRQHTLLITAYEAIRSSPPEALSMASELPASGARDELIAHACGEWAMTNPEAAVAWAKQIPGDGLRQHVLAAVAIAWSNHEPVAAASLAVKSLVPDRSLDDTLIGIVQRWVQYQPEATIAWIAQFPEGPLRETALENVDRFRSSGKTLVP